ncbi:hypothetical protein HYS72_03005 [Candidatus Pacearchaeota archaeon]|nr:hypothetical protein [Candidatus Pacearchaeota archaeon]MBI2056826.1 hypothetical protein [Candidatus Pacearchaeota archaeon]
MKKSLIELLKSKGFPMKRRIGHSKNYLKENKENLVVFNAMIYERELYYKIKNLEFPSVIRISKKGNTLHEKRNKRWYKREYRNVWYGDLDLSKDIRKLYDAIELKKDIIITSKNGDKILELNGMY